MLSYGCGETAFLVKLLKFSLWKLLKDLFLKHLCSKFFWCFFRSWKVFPEIFIDFPRFWGLLWPLKVRRPKKRCFWPFFDGFWLLEQKVYWLRASYFYRLFSWSFYICVVKEKLIRWSEVSQITIENSQKIENSRF